MISTSLSFILLVLMYVLFLAELRQKLGKIPGVPLVYLNKVIMVLEPPSESSVRYNKKHEMLKATLQETEEEIISSLKARGVGSAEKVGAGSVGEGNKSQPEQNERKKRKAIASNPLACKKTDPSSHNSKKMKRDKMKRRSTQ